MKNIKKLIKEAYKALTLVWEEENSLYAGEPAYCNNIGWDGDPSNSFGRDCVLEEIWKEEEYLLSRIAHLGKCLADEKAKPEQKAMPRRGDRLRRFED